MLVYIALGSALGGVVRYLASGVVQQWSGAEAGFPAGTLAVNVTGSLLLGFLMRYTLATPGISPEWRAALTIGFCGGYTTFSTFSYELVRLMEDGAWTRAAAYAGASVLVSLAAVWAGFSLARAVLGPRSA